MALCQKELRRRRRTNQRRRILLEASGGTSDFTAISDAKFAEKVDNPADINWGGAGNIGNVTYNDDGSIFIVGDKGSGSRLVTCSTPGYPDTTPVPQDPDAAFPYGTNFAHVLWSHSGAQAFHMDSAGYTVSQTCSTPYDITTGTYNSDRAFMNDARYAKSAWWNADQSSIITFRSGNTPTLTQFDVATSGELLMSDFTGAGKSDGSINLKTDVTDGPAANILAGTFNEDGTQFLGADSVTAGKVYIFTLDVAYSVSSGDWTYFGTVTLSDPGQQPYALAVPVANQLLWVGGTTLDIWRYDFS